MKDEVLPTAPVTLAQLAEVLGGSLVGDPAIEVSTLVHPRMVKCRSELVFVMDPALLEALRGTPARAAVIARAVAVPPGMFQSVISVDRPRYALAKLMEIFARPVHAPPGIHPAAIVEAGAEVGDDVSIGPFVTVGPGASIGARTVLMAGVTIGAGARIGQECLLHPGVRVGERVLLGDRVIIHHNASLGADGFSFVTPDAASFESAKGGGDSVSVSNRGIRRINSIGTVSIGDDVEIGACTAIDRANLGATTVGRGTKIDNQVQIAHNCQIGEECLISGRVGISGSCRVGNRVVLAGGVGLADHITVGDDAVVGAGSGVWRDVLPGQVVMGYPALPKTEALAREMNVGRLKRLFRDLADLRRRVHGLEKK